jgi:serine/threonine-protein kinase
VATQRDLTLARRLLQAAVLDRAAIEDALAFQGERLTRGQGLTLEQALYARGHLPAGALDAVDAPPLERLQPFSGYRIDGPIGEGGGSVVYRGVYRANGTVVAVKVLDPVHRLRRDYRERFFHEARLHVELDHENIVAGYERGTQNGYDFYTMDWIDGATVLEVIERRGGLGNEEALAITCQVARALGYLHGRGLLHRDIKPGNVMVEASGRVRLIDLGLVGEMGAPGQEGVTVGTVEYLSPEQARGAADLDRRADIYGLGMTLYHMVVGEVAFQGESDYEVMAKQVLERLDAQKIKTRRIGPEVQYLIARMTAKDREERCPDVSEVIRLIEGYLPAGIVPVDLGAPPTVAPVAPPASAKARPPAPSPRGEPPVRRRRRR